MTSHCPFLMHTTQNQIIIAAKIRWSLSAFILQDAILKTIVYQEQNFSITLSNMSAKYSSQLNYQFPNFNLSNRLSKEYEIDKSLV